MVRGGAWSRGCMVLGRCLALGGVCMVPGGCLVPGRLVETPPKATAAGGTHPTAMHSCSGCICVSAPNFGKLAGDLQTIFYQSVSAI